MMWAGGEDVRVGRLMWGKGWGYWGDVGRGRGWRVKEADVG